MKPGSTDSILTVLASLLVTAVLFIAQHFTSAPRLNQRSLPEDNLAEASSSAPSEHAWAERTWAERAREARTASTSTSNRPAAPFDSPFGTAQSGTSNDSPSRTAAPNKLPSISATSRTFQPSAGSASANSGSQTNNPRATDSSADTFKVVSVIDGDTVDVLVNRQPFRLRLNGIDTPEKGQPFGNAAKDALAKAIGGQNVQYVVRDTDRYNRSIADIYFRGVHVNKWLIQKGLAWHYKAYNDDPELSQAEQEASAASRGLWADPRRVAPWNWRKLSKVERDQYR